MKLGPAPKTYTRDGHRTVPPRVTLARVEPLCAKMGVTEMQDITDLDRTGIPVFAVSRPSAGRGAVTLYKGKGASMDQAKVSALMETLERFSGEQNDRQVEIGFTEAMLSSGDAIDPRSLILPQMSQFHVMSQPIAWTRGYDLIREEEVWLPASAVFHPYLPTRDMPLFRSHTNGLASGNVMEEAILHGICEVIERDAWSICEFSRKVRADIDPNGSELVSELISRFEDKGMRIHLKDLTCDVDIPTVGASCDDVETRDPNLLTIGVGTHLNPEIAVIRALTEVAQSRATFLHMRSLDPRAGSINDRIGYDKVKNINRMWFTDAEDHVALPDMPRIDTDDIYDDLNTVLEELKRRDFGRAVVADLTCPDIEVPVVRVVVPGMEVYTMDEDRIGPRLIGRRF
jgi:ribosomal protein S12 methylthiotransferase accessory factor